MKENILLLIVVSVLIYSMVAPYDDTDDIENSDRSGLILYVDHRTGLHYLQGGLFGGITPRLNADGTQVREH